MGKIIARTVRFRRYAQNNRRYGEAVRQKPYNQRPSRWRVELWFKASTSPKGPWTRSEGVTVTTRGVARAIVRDWIIPFHTIGVRPSPSDLRRSSR